MDGDTEQAPFRSGIDGKIEHRTVQGAVHDALNSSGGFFQNQEIVGTDEFHAGRLIKSSQDRADRQIVIKHHRRWREGLDDGCDRR